MNVDKGLVENGNGLVEKSKSQELIEPVEGLIEKSNNGLVENQKLILRILKKHPNQLNMS